MKWGILACGSIAEKFAKTVNAMAMAGEGESLSAAASRDPERARAFCETHQIPRAYGSYEELAGDMELEAVYIATPNNLHAENTRMLLEAGKHVLCEKPFTTNAKDAEALYRLAEEKGLFCMEAFWIRFLPLYEYLLEMIHSGKYGALRHVRSEYGFIAKGARRERKFRSDLGGGALLDIGVYNLGFLQMLMGESPEAFSSEVTFNEYGTDSFSTISLRYPGGRTAYVLQTIGLDIARHAALFFDEATIRLPDFQGAQSMIIRPNGGEEYEIRCPFDVNGFEYEIREASRCIREGKSQSSRFTPEDSVKLLRLMDKIRETWGMRFSYE